MEKIKILYISPAYYPNIIGGSERSVKMLAEGIAEDDRFECFVLSFDGKSKEPQHEEYNKVKTKVDEEEAGKMAGIGSFFD